ncbi:MAG: 6-phosphogluconolactonase [Alphaproteobacteria bacterium]|nr:6-phosphogluconolactonase [Alphaproteobacteria bacterium]
MSRCSIRVFDTPHLAAAAAGDKFMEGVSEFGSRLAGLAAGRTMQPVYDHLVSTEARSNGLFSETAFAQLDEVLSNSRTVPSFANEIDSYLLSRLSGRYRSFLIIDGQASRPDLEAKRHRAAILKSGGLGVQLLGIGVNGHVGFNEPGCRSDSLCRVTDLAKSTVERNGYPLRTGAITLGIGDIMSAQRIIMVATGAVKSPAIAAMIEGPQSGACPASLLRAHADMELFLDQAAAKDLS